MVITPELLKLALGILGAVGSVIVAAVGLLTVKAYKLGKLTETIETTAEEIHDAKKAIERVGEKIERIGVIDTRLGMLEGTTARNTSDIRELVERLSKQEGREQMRSRPDWNGE